MLRKGMQRKGMSSTPAIPSTPATPSTPSSPFTPTALAASLQAALHGSPSVLLKFVQFVSLTYLTLNYVVESTVLLGTSMQPTFRSSGEVVLVEKVSCRLYGLEGGDSGSQRASANRQKSARVKSLRTPSPRGADPEGEEPPVPPRESYAIFARPLSKNDIVVASSLSRTDGSGVCKRIVGLPGDVIIANDRFLEHTGGNGFSGIGDGLSYRRRRYVVPDGHVWLEGDNSKCSIDSRDYGPVPASLIRGRVFFRVNFHKTFKLGLVRKEGGGRKEEEGGGDNQQLKSEVRCAGSAGAWSDGGLGD